MGRASVAMVPPHEVAGDAPRQAAEAAVDDVALAGWFWRAWTAEAPPLRDAEGRLVKIVPLAPAQPRQT